MRFNIGQIGGDLDRTGWLSRRPVAFSIHPTRGSVDIDNIRLADGTGRELIANTDFARAGAR